MFRRRLAAGMPVHRHALPQLAVDGALVALAYVLAYHLRFDTELPHRYELLLEQTLPWVIAGSLLVFAVFGLYAKQWRYSDARDYEAILKAVLVTTFAIVGLIAVLHPVISHPLITRGGVRFRGDVAVTMPTGVAALFGLLQLLLLCGARYAVHRLRERPLRGFRPGKDARAVLIVGAGNGGRLVLKEMIANPELGYRPVGFVDDDPRKANMRVERGVRVLGSTSDKELPRILDEVEPDEVIIAIPSAPGSLRQRVVTACRRRSIPVRTTPTVFELLLGGPKVMRQVRDVQVEDVLGREPVRPTSCTASEIVKKYRVIFGSLTVTGPSAAIWRRKIGTTEPEDPRTFPKRTEAKRVFG